MTILLFERPLPAFSTQYMARRREGCGRRPQIAAF
jgi:hypothetical protein